MGEPLRDNAPAYVTIPVTDYIYWVRLMAKRDRKGAKWCRKKGLGRDRAILGTAPPLNVLPLQKIDHAERAFALAREEAKKRLADICGNCRRCPLGR
jgi:hypothetical protein